MLIVPLRSLSSEVLDFHQQQRHAVLLAAAMEEAARLYEHFHQTGQPVTSSLSMGAGTKKQADAMLVQAPTTKKIVEAVKQSVETMREDILDSLLRSMPGTK
jgi:hypothetical protein